MKNINEYDRFPALPGPYSALPASLPVAIDYPAALAHDDYPKYLLAPEVSALLHYIPDLYRQTLMPHCGIPARVLMKHWR